MSIPDMWVYEAESKNDSEIVACVGLLIVILCIVALGMVWTV